MTSAHRRWTATALLAAGIAVLGGCGGTARHQMSATDAGTTLDRPLPARIQQLPLVTSAGVTTSLGALHGRIVVISDTMTLCGETCPLDTANLVQTARAVEAAGLGDKVAFATVTIDPARDTPAQLAAYRALYSPPPADWLALTGTPANLAELWKYLGVWYQRVPEGNPPDRNWRTGAPLTYDLDHADELYFLDAAGHLRFLISGPADVQPGTPLPSAMRSYLDTEGVANLLHPQSDAWTVPQALQELRSLTGRAIPPAT